jgi:alanine racemase
MRPTWAVIDLDAIAHNARVLRDAAAPAALCAVVKADGYGHGAVAVARAALAGGATWLAVALVEEGIELRDAGVRAPVLVLSEPPADALAEACGAGLTPFLYTPEGVAAASSAAARVGRGPWSVHLKVDTGMHRVGCAPADAVDLARSVAAAPDLALGGTATHLAVADEPGRPESGVQLDRFDTVLADLAAAGIDPGIRHAANSAGTLAHPRARLDLVRCGIAVVGVAPSVTVGASPSARGLRPAMTVRAEVTLVKDVPAGEGVSYGLRHTFDYDAVVATVPVGYADGVRRALGLTGGEVLIGGVRRPVRGVVTMDQLVVEVTGGPPVAPGDEVVLLGAQGGERITADEWADRLDTIAYEVLTGISPRLPRRHRGAVAATRREPAP